jgi:hypothetical protein
LFAVVAHERGLHRDALTRAYRLHIGADSFNDTNHLMTRVVWQVDEWMHAVRGVGV